MAKKITAVKRLELAQEIRSKLLVTRAVERTDIYDFYISIAEYRINFLFYGQKEYGDINKTLTINNLFELNILLYLFEIKKQKL